jgi:2-polyprenyl-3-methyl-5-hydroxy-6-metoxy-1,4-benzoquinol methylase
METRANSSIPGLIPEERAEFDKALVDALPRKDRLRILDAGCGRKFPLSVPTPAHFTGIDISWKSMSRSNHLDSYLVGDIQEFALEDKFDLIACIYVLEHVKQPRAAIDNLIHAIDEGGVLVLCFPNPLSTKGLVTKLTPHAFHVFYAKRVLKYRRAGVEGNAPFPTHLRFQLRPAAVLRQLELANLEVLFCSRFEGVQPQRTRQASSFIFRMYQLIAGLIDALTLGKARARLSETLIIARR